MRVARSPGFACARSAWKKPGWRTRAASPRESTSDHDSIPGANEPRMPTVAFSVATFGRMEATGWCSFADDTMYATASEFSRMYWIWSAGWVV